MPGSAGNRRIRVGRIGLAVIVVCIGVGAGLSEIRGSSAAVVGQRREAHPQTAWVACNRNARNGRPSTFRPLADAAAAALVTPEPETRPDNGKPFSIDGRLYAAPNDYVPTARQLAQFWRARTSAGQPNLQFNPYYRYVDGRDGMRRPTTDELIQWAAHKWGIPENWLRAEYVHESYWNQFMLGDATPVSGRDYGRYPSQSRVRGSSSAYQSLGITQVRWAPDGSLHPGTEPLRWQSTAFNVDYQAATLRFYYDNPQGTRTEWNDRSYQPCEKWNSLGGWFSPYPWGNAGQETYVRAVQQILAQRAWTTGSFQSWSPSSFPPGLRIR